jgi:hypothetical protein
MSPECNSDILDVNLELGENKTLVDVQINSSVHGRGRACSKLNGPPLAVVYAS